MITKVGTCPACKAETVFRLVGEQEGFEELPSFQLYNCISCGTTINSAKIKERKLAHERHSYPSARP